MRSVMNSARTMYTVARAGRRRRETRGRFRESMRQEIRELALKLCNYHHMNHGLEKADAILVLCSYDTAVAERGAQLFLGGWAPLLIFSGGLGAITKNLCSEPEADQFAAIARRLGVTAQ